jgi:thioredoxin 1
MKLIDVTADNFESAITGKNVPSRVVVISVSSPKCTPCRQFAPVFEAAAERHRDVAFGTINTEQQADLTDALEINSIPTILGFREGVLLFDEPGSLSNQALDELIRQLKIIDMAEIRRHVEEQIA